MLGSVVDLQPLGERVSLGGLEGFIQPGDLVGVQVVHDQNDDLGVGVVDGEQFLDLAGPVDPGPPGQCVDPPPPGQGLDPHQDRTRAVPYVLAVLQPVVALGSGVAGSGSRAWANSW